MMVIKVLIITILKLKGLIVTISIARIIIMIIIIIIEIVKMIFMMKIEIEMIKGKKSMRKNQIDILQKILNIQINLKDIIMTIKIITEIHLIIKKKLTEERVKMILIMKEKMMIIKIILINIMIKMGNITIIEIIL